MVPFSSRSCSHVKVIKWHLFSFKKRYWVKRSSFEWNLAMFSLKEGCVYFKKLTTWVWENERERKKEQQIPRLDFCSKIISRFFSFFLIWLYLTFKWVVKYNTIFNLGNHLNFSELFFHLKIFLVKGQTNSKWFFQDDVSSKKQTNKFDFTTCRLVFICFLEESEDTEKTFRNLSLYIMIVILIG